MENVYAPPQADLALAEPSFADELPPAERFARLGARLVDGVLAVVCVAPFVVAAIVASGLGENRDDLGAGIAFFAAAGVGLLIYGVVQTVMLSTRGQSVGKRVLGIRIVRRDGSLPGFVHAVLLRSWLFALLGNIPFIGGVIGIVDTLMIFRENRACLHDDVAGTMVVQGQPE